MHRYFVDTFYWIALLYRRDTWHARVTAFSETLTNDDVLFTTDAVLTEFLAALSAAGPRMRQRAADRVDDILHDPRHHVVEMTRSQFLEGLTLYKSRLDKAYSVTDCFSMNVMRHEGLTDILTNDRHFTQEGFRILFPDGQGPDHTAPCPSDRRELLQQWQNGRAQCNVSLSVQDEHQGIKECRHHGESRAHDRCDRLHRRSAFTHIPEPVSARAR